MCKISVYQYICKHHIQHVWSACRGQIKVAKNSDAPACQKYPSLYVNIISKCGSCSRAEAEQIIRHELNITSEQNLSAEIEETLQWRLADVAAQFPTTNWGPSPSPVYSRKPSQKRLYSQRRSSLLKEEVKAEDMCGPEAWEDNVVLPVYETVADGWDYEWTSDTKSLADELVEDKAERGEALEGEAEAEEEEEESEDDEEEVESFDATGTEGGEITLTGQHETTILNTSETCRSNPEKSHNSPAMFSKGSSVCYWFKQTTPEAKVRQRELLVVRVS